MSHLSDDDLLTSTRRLVAASNQVFAQLLLHLAEVETRGIHRTRACSSLYTYCIYELRMSEDAAARRSSAARLVKQFPLVFDAIARGELHLTGLLMLGPHLTAKNHVEVLARAKFRTKKELAKLVRELHPLPRVPDLVEPLGPEPRRALHAPTWEEWVTSLCPPVRELKAGEAPRDWANDTVEGTGTEAIGFGVKAAGSPLPAEDDLEDFTTPARRDPPPITPPQQYQMQFSPIEEHARLVERAKVLLARSSPGVSLGELHLQAMRLLVGKLEQEKFGVNAGARRSKQSTRQSLPAPLVQTAARAPAESLSRHCTRDGAHPAPRLHDSDSTTPIRTTTEPPRQRGTETLAPTCAAPRQCGDEPPRRRGRHIPAAVKRVVFARDAGCCSYVDERGQRCGETRYLELHHLKPFARGGEHQASNLALRCAAHNALAAEAEFGRSLVEQKRHSARHGRFSSQISRD